MATAPGQHGRRPICLRPARKAEENRLDKPVRDRENPYHPRLKTMTPACKHPIVKVVAREDDVEFVECQQCGEVFDSAEFSDMAMEEEAETREED